MLDNYLLEELVTFAQTGTLAKTASQLNVTQPTVTRGMQKLETDWGVRLFDRQPNRITLTATGKLAAREATTLLQAQHEAIAKVQNYDRNQRILIIGSTIPGPRILINHVAPTISTPIKIEQTLITADDPTALLTDNTYSLLFSSQPLQTSTVTSSYLGNERLSINLNRFMYQANQSSITFDELKNLSFLVLTDIGPWRAVIQHAIPNAKFLYQEQREAFEEISKYADFPYFSTNLSNSDAHFPKPTPEDGRVRVPISDEQASIAVYAAYLRSNTAAVTPIITTLTEAWPD
ncbi:LysR family transcriptional regulator [Levilactobacillus parabrevis]|uniref:LysR family transcriptional regulator n=1 Tax=Levilactobacillus parabrevis TaxID=357278 RepID=UPI0021A389D8|nr:LysR family transcriptional regulator [Levilactobacillus parabrevis]MCT4486504.1 LysR family transcriptional regulator [Levilactobacillus parabrevis]MCT4489871.1 LysR family transcriptional regulator [Levilactobacillus parabrevis]